MTTDNYQSETTTVIGGNLAALVHISVTIYEWSNMRNSGQTC